MTSRIVQSYHLRRTKYSDWNSYFAIFRWQSQLERISRCYLYFASFLVLSRWPKRTQGTFSNSLGSKHHCKPAVYGKLCKWLINSVTCDYQIHLPSFLQYPLLPGQGSLWEWKELIAISMSESYGCMIYRTSRLDPWGVCAKVVILWCQKFLMPEALLTNQC